MMLGSKGILSPDACGFLRINGIATIEAANESLNSYTKDFNKKYAVPLDTFKSLYEKQPDSEKINLLLAVLSSRKIDSGSCLKYHNRFYIPTDARGAAVHHRKGTKAMVMKAFDDGLYCAIGEQVYALEILPEHRETSKVFDLVPLPEKPKKHYIPPMSHPLKQASFEKYMRSQSHRTKAS